MVRLRALDRKLLRDLLRIWAQALAIGLVLACGIAVMVLATGAARSLDETRETYYERNRFAEIFAAATRVPLSLASGIAAIEGVAQVDTRIAGHAVLDMPGMEAPATARIIALPVAGEPVLNVPVLRQGRLPDPLRVDEVAVSEAFAEAHGLVPGDRFDAILDGQRRTLSVTGMFLSPEFIYVTGPGSFIPDNRAYGIVWMSHDAAASAYGLDGAFNEVSVTLARGASQEAVIEAIDRLLDPYGGTGAHGREQQMSHAFLDNELQQLAAMARILPPVFLIASAFLVNMVLGRLISLERPQIGLLKAVGYTTREIAFHYVKMTVGIGIIGVLAGWVVGAWLGSQLTALYSEYFRFPFLLFVPSPGVFVWSGLLGVGTVVAGALRSVLSTVRLSPAVAMSPPAPPHFSRGMLDRIGNLLRIRQTGMMILRSIARWPGRAAVTMFGMSAAVAVLIASFFAFDSVNEMMDEMFGQANRQNVTLTLSQARQEAVLQHALSLPGVMRAEGIFTVPVRVVTGHLSHLGALEGRPRGATLARLLDEDGEPIELPQAGLAMPESLARKLGLAVGQAVEIELLAPPRETITVPLAAITRQAMGQDVHMDRDELFRAMRRAPQLNRLDLLVDPAMIAALNEEVKRTPAIGGMSVWPDMLARFREMTDENLLRMTLIYSILGILITFGVVYNAARIQLSERMHELASLRVLGFRRGEVAFMLVGEIMLLAVLALPVGWVLGYGFAWLTAQGFSSDLFTIPLVVERRTYGLASIIVFASALASALIVKRRLDRIEIATALKQKE